MYTRLTVTRYNEVLINLPILLIIIAAVCAPHAALICALLAFFTGCTVRIERGVRRAPYFRRSDDYRRY